MSPKDGRLGTLNILSSNGRITLPRHDPRISIAISPDIDNTLPGIIHEQWMSAWHALSDSCMTSQS